MITSNGKFISLICDCPKCRHPSKAVCARVGFFQSPPSDDEQAIESARRAGWQITPDGFCMAPGHSFVAHLEKKRKSCNEIEID